MIAQAIPTPALRTRQRARADVDDRRRRDLDRMVGRATPRQRGEPFAVADQLAHDARAATATEEPVESHTPWSHGRRSSRMKS